MLKNIVLLIVTCLIVLLLSEAAFRLFKPQIFEVHPRGMYITNSKVGYVLKPGFEGIIEREEFKQYFKVNNLGMRGRDIAPKKKNAFRIFILGDSYAFGFGVKEIETFGARLQKCLLRTTKKNVEVINGGVPGFGTIDQLNFLKLWGHTVNPDLIILQFLPVNDFEENRTPAVKWSDVKDGWLTSKYPDQSVSLSFSSVTYWMKTHFHSAKFISERLGYLAMKYGILGNMQSFWGEDFSRDDEQITGKAIHDIAEYAGELHSDLLLLYTAGQGLVLSESQEELRSEKFIKNITAREKIKWINTLREMRKLPNKNELYFHIDGHWTPAGHLAVAQMICKQVR